MFSKALIDVDWTKRSCPPQVIPERMIALDHPKGQRLVSSMITKYSMLLPFLTGPSTILEACCGAGFGASMLAQSGHDVVGVDFDKEAIAFAQEHRPDVEFYLEDIYNFERTDFDAVVFIDAIEHFEKEDQPTILAHLYSKLRSGGILLIDTPLAKKSGRVSRAHVWELDQADFRSVVDASGWYDLIRRFYIDNSYNFPVVTEDYAPDIHGVQDQVIIARKG